MSYQSLKVWVDPHSMAVRCVAVAAVFVSTTLALAVTVLSAHVPLTWTRLLAVLVAGLGVSATSLACLLAFRSLGALEASMRAIEHGRLGAPSMGEERQAMVERVSARLVHELAHPIQNLGNGIMLFRNDDKPESRETLLRQMERELATIRRLFDDLRDVSRPKAIERLPFDVNKCAADVVDLMREHGKDRGVTIQRRYAPGPQVIEGDRVEVGRVLRYLVMNAIQATEPGGGVVITTSNESTHVAIRVTDSGSGNPAKRRGFGLGLAISKRIVEQLNGTIAVGSAVESAAGLTTFTVRFPLMALERPVQQARRT
jgi:signal transduction histidine kinase